MNYYVANMASGEAEPPDASLNKFYKCHHNVRVGAVVCIVCGNFFYTSEIVTKYNAGNPIQFLSNLFIVCQDHPNLVLTSKLPYGSLSETAWQFIAQLKLENREQIKKEIVNNIVHEQEEENGLNKTIYENYTESDSLKIENNLLKQLLKETQDKNKLLNELFIKERQNNNFKNIKPHFCRNFNKYETRK